MPIKYRFNKQKAIEVLLYIASRQSDKYHALKILYFADKLHLEKYGRLICGDSYVAMKHGHVPSGAYDITKSANGQGLFPYDPEIEKAIVMEGNKITPKRGANIEMLSESDRECLDSAIKECASMSFDELKDICHREPSFQAADENDSIPLEEIIKQLKSGAELLDYLQLA